MDNGTTGDTSALDSAVDRIGASLFEPSEATSSEAVAEPTAPATEPDAPPILEVPKSWPKEMHDHWGKTPREVQDYWSKREKQMLDGLEQYKQDATFGKPLRDILNPYQPILQQMRLTPHQAVDALMRAHVRLTQGSIEDRRKAYEELGRNLQIIQDQSQQAASNGTPMDPTVQRVLREVDTIKQSLAARQQAEYAEAQAKAAKEVEAFASDTKAHPHFDEVADDIAAFIQQGKSLQDAYDMAVWANPLTREKLRQAAVQTELDKFKENARLDSLPKKRAAGVNVKSGDSARTPAEPVGSLEETIRDAHRQIKQRVS